MVDLEWYRTFKAIYRKGTLTGAAQELFISQPNVGQHLAALEAHIGKALFERKPRKMVPTDYGKLLYTQLVEAVEKLEQIETQFRFTGTADFPMLFIGTSHEFFNFVMAENVGKSPLNFVFEFGDELTDKLLSDRLSFLFSSVPIDHKGLICEPVFRENFLLVGHVHTDTSEFDKFVADKDLAGMDKWLSKQVWLVYNSNLVVIRRFWLDNFKKRPALKPRHIIPEFLGLLKTMIIGGGITVAPDYMLEGFLERGELKVIWKGFASSHNSIYLTYNPKNVTSEQIDLARKLVLKQ